MSTTRAAYEATAESYADSVGTEISAAIEAPLDRALLEAFVESLANATAGPVADLGCGPGRVAAFLAGRGIDALGVDVSPAMLAIARRVHPGIDFQEGRLTDLPLATGSLAGAVCWYSIIHTPPEHLGAVFEELDRVLNAKSQVLVAFQAGTGQAVHRSGIHAGSGPLISYRHSPDVIIRHLADAGLPAHAQALRGAELPHESTAQAFVWARRRGDDPAGHNLEEGR